MSSTNVRAVGPTGSFCAACAGTGKQAVTARLRVGWCHHLALHTRSLQRCAAATACARHNACMRIIACHASQGGAAQVPLNEYEFPAGKVANVQQELQRLIEKNYYLHQGAKDAYRAYLLAYNSHSLKDIFNVHTLDLAAVANSFGFPVPPRVRTAQWPAQLLCAAACSVRQAPLWCDLQMCLCAM